MSKKRIYPEGYVYECKQHGLRTQKEVYVRPKSNKRYCILCAEINHKKNRHIELGPEVYEKKCTRCQNIINKEQFSPGNWKLKSGNCKKCSSEISLKNRYIKLDESVKERKCSRCQTIKIKEEFEPYEWILRGAYCRQCRMFNSEIDYQRNKSYLKRKYNIDQEYYNNLIFIQNNRCKICLQEETKKDKVGNIQKLSIDHCHKSTKEGKVKVRGLLCFYCNTMLGMAKDDPETLRLGALYLENNK